MAITSILRSFFQDVFNNKSSKAFPTLEDVFTLIDLSAGSGHNLGKEYPPNKLRALRRMLIHRVLRILDDRYSPNRPLAIQDFLGCIPGINDSQLGFAFVVLNWDIVLEKQLLALPVNAPIDYCCNCENIDRLFDPNNPRRIRICKMHGSGNWVYCDNCKSLFYRDVEKVALTSGADIISRDFDLFQPILQDTNIILNATDFDTNSRLTCIHCQNRLSFHIATFSYRKSFRNPAYAFIWSAAEKLLSSASNWVFVGYSLPEADYELKHLCKVSELQHGTPKQIIVIDPKPIVHKKYRALFGNGIVSYKCKFDDKNVLEAIHNLN